MTAHFLAVEGVADVANGLLFLVDRFKLAIAVDRESGRRIAAGQPVGHCRDRRQLGVQRLEREFVETLAEVFDHLLGLALAAGIDGKPAVLRVDPDLGLAPPGEGTRHQFLGDPFLQFAQLLAAGKVAVFELEGFGPLLGFLVDH